LRIVRGAREPRGWRPTTAAFNSEHVRKSKPLQGLTLRAKSLRSKDALRVRA
jgi:hypothetical protein